VNNTMMQSTKMYF